jgi:hypothetical protein
MPRDEATAQGFWELFSAGDVGPAEFGDAIVAGEPFTAAVTLQSIYRQTPKVCTIDFRPVAASRLSGSAVGVPADLRLSPLHGSAGGSSSSAARRSTPLYYFAIIQPDNPIRRGSQERQRGPGAAPSPPPAPAAPPAAPPPRPPAAPVPALNKSMPTAFIDVRLGPLIGRGAYGRVYRGSWNGNTVAVKVMETTEPIPDAAAPDGGGDRERSVHGGASRGLFEAVLSSALSHPNIVHTYQYAVRPASRGPAAAGARAAAAPANGGPRGAPGRAINEVWVISEFCNRGPLLTAIERGAFLTQPSAQHGQPNLISVLQTLQEVAAAMHYLHNHDILHGDLTGGNVLLTAADKDSRGFSAKVVDFGLSRVVQGSAGLKTRTMGCAEYM